ncbi:hypothetical protein TTHERM_00094250 (macronuclear) [Tetrahymena thermophila SB210]|uniref:Tetratricopeptide repeat protein n=1 Tax=Tetrahymena thermophila (strain SB210) TaxID=312017 RepID=Q235W6_TETTS|nr:hypothetical protein TTHERM_00094250 [Tetrahymena thermophila SB210]EAR92634.1 hypothetical protein TTHERM_00094250 [Tetrahymena thermophila SB210]|eukprot:XP_001012879.1 hypothetical protein TTHERM_00094250 [Tetrahymena thermophila SB210]
MSIKNSQQNLSRCMLQQAINLYYESQIDESLEVLNKIEQKDLQFIDQVIQKRYLLLNLIAQGDLGQARDLRNQILNQYLRLKWCEDDTLKTYKLNLEEIILIICIWSYHTIFLQGGGAGAETQDLLYVFKKILEIQNSQLSEQENLLFKIFLDGEADQQDKLLQSFSGRLLEDLLVYATVNHLHFAPSKKPFYDLLVVCGEQAYQINPKHPLMCYFLGFHYFYRDIDKSFDYFNKQFELYNKNIYCNTYYLKFLVLNKNHMKFLQVYDQVKLINKNHHRVALAYAEYLVDNHKSFEAFECIINSLKNKEVKQEINQDYFQWFSIQVDELFENDFQIQIYEQAIELDFENYRFYDQLSNAYLKQGQYERLIQLYNRYKLKEEKDSSIESQIYEQVLQIYIEQKDYQNWIELKMKNKDKIDSFVFDKFDFNQKNLELTFIDHSIYIIDELDCLIQQYEKKLQQKENKSRFRISEKKKIELKQYSTFFQLLLEQHSIYLQQQALAKQFKDIEIYKKSILLQDLYY